MGREDENTTDDATSVKGPAGPPAAENTPYDPEMTEGDEANIPPESDADPEASA